MKNRPEQPSPQLPRIAAVVITYQPDATVLDNLRKLVAQVSPVIVVDNGSQGASAKLVEAAGTLAGVQLIRNPSNLGIATALNIGIRQALRGGSQWVATFDQDSAITEGFFKKFFDAWNACPVREQVGMIVPGHWAYDPALEIQQDSKAPSLSFVQGAPTSGSLIKAEVFQAAGYYDDALFIDYVDTDACLRVLKCGFKILSAAQVVLKHSLGEEQVRNVLGFRLAFRIHAAWRYYYIMRNRVVLFRRHGRVFPFWALYDASRMLLELGRIACLEQERILKLNCAARGIWDGLRGKVGRHQNFP